MGGASSDMLDTSSRCCCGWFNSNSITWCSVPDGGKWTVDDIITNGLIVGRGVAHGEGGFFVEEAQSHP